MKKMLSVLAALLMIIAALIPATAETAGRDISGIWSDENYDRMLLTILPADVTWFDERMGEDTAENKYLVVMNWANSASEETVYTIVGILDETGRILTYQNGLLSEFAYDEQGNVDEENTSILDDQGEGALTLTENDTLLWQDSCVQDGAKMVLRRESPFMADTEMMLEGFYRPVLTLESETAGASLKLAQAVRDVFRFCAEHPFWTMDQQALKDELSAAQATLTEEEKAVFLTAFGALNAEITRLMDERQELGANYADAQADRQVNALRNDPSVRYSVKALMDTVGMLNGNP